MDIDPGDGLLLRANTSLATGGCVFFVASVLYLLLGKFRKIQAVFVFLLLPLSLVAVMMKVIMYKEFGMEINYRVIGLFREDFKALWSIATESYHVDWLSLAVTLVSVAVTRWIYSGRAAPVPAGNKAGVTLAVLLVSSGVVASALRRDIEHLAYFHPDKTSRAAVFQLGDLCQSLISGPRTGHESILKRGGEYTGSVAQVVRERLGEDPASFTARHSKRPPWLKKQPSHVFLFLMESMESKLIEDPTCKVLAPNLNAFARQGVYVPRFVSAGHSTIEAVHCISTGAAPIFRYPVNEYPSPRVAAMYSLDTLPKLMRRSGYKPLFLAGSFRKFRSKGDVCEAYGYDRFIGCPDVATSIPANDWGVNDADFFQWTDGITGGLTEPHFVTFLNVSNHAPFDSPVDSIRAPGVFTPAVLNFFHGASEKEKLNYARHVYYADQQIGKMIHRLKSLYPDALFVLVGDHNARKLKGLRRGRVPFVLWNDRVVDPGTDTASWYGSHMDVLATLAEALLPEGSVYHTLGRPVWSAAPDRVSIGNERILCAHGIFPFDRKKPELSFAPDASPTPVRNTAWSAERLKLKASAVEALSWGQLHSVAMPDR